MTFSLIALCDDLEDFSLAVIYGADGAFGHAMPLAPATVFAQASCPTLPYSDTRDDEAEEEGGAAPATPRGNPRRGGGDGNRLGELTPDVQRRTPASPTHSPAASPRSRSSSPALELADGSIYRMQACTSLAHPGLCCLRVRASTIKQEQSERWGSATANPNQTTKISSHASCTLLGLIIRSPVCRGCKFGSDSCPLP